MNPREGHFIAAKQIFKYLAKFPDGELVMDLNIPNHSAYLSDLQEYKNLVEFYLEAMEEIPEDMPNLGPNPAHLTINVDADHAHNQVSRRSVTSICILLNGTVIKWVSK